MTGVTLLLTLGIMEPCGVSATVLAVVAFAVIGLSLIILATKLLSAALNYQTSGLAINNGKITAYSGGFVKTVTVLMNKNLIAVADVTTPLRKKAGIATFVLHLKTNAQSNEIKVPIQEAGLLKKLEELLIL